jgi:prepilin signal peptidase PulO-like enzyme (type II secretory pathway)
MADAFLVISLGLAMGIWCILGVLFVALLLAGVWSAILLAFKKVGRKKLIPFAPFLLAAYGGVLLAI